jgi:hypothetical protein
MFASRINRPTSDTSSDFEGSLLKGFLTRRSRGREHFAVSYHPPLSAAQAGNAQEDSIHGRDEADENDEEYQVYQLGDASRVGAIGLDKNWQST